MADGFIPPHGGYANLLSYRKAEIVYDATYETFRKGIEHRDPAISANVIVGLIKATDYLLDRQLRRLETDFLKDGGLRERMTRARLTERDRQRKQERKD
jgi:four helix bundle suffix protein